MPKRSHPEFVRVFLSSPGDVADERAAARRLLKEELPYDRLLQGRITFEVVSWDDPAGKLAMPANLTPQEAVNRFGPMPSECDVVVVVLWSRLGTHLDMGAFRKLNGEPYLSGTEWEFENALNSRPQPELFVYWRKEEPKVGMKDPNWAEKRRQYELVEQFFDQFKNPDGSFRRSWKPYDTTTEFQKYLADDLKSILRERLDSGLYVRGIAKATPAVWVGSPYPGLRPFTPEEAPIFFGRGHDVDALITRLRESAQRALIVVGVSGGGKSSLVSAGLLPRLSAGALEGSEHWRVLTFTPGAAGDNPFLALASELKGMLPAPKQRSPIAIASALSENPQSLSEYVDLILAGRPASAALVLYVDQLEELFTQVSEEHRGAFAELLIQATTNRRLRVLATLRADFLSQSTAEEGLEALLRVGTFVLGPPGPAALADIVRRPDERAGLSLEDGLADRILIEAGGDPGALPLIAFCLEELYYRTAPQQQLTLGAYEAMGGLRGAIGQRADKLLAEFAEVDEIGLNNALSKVFENLVLVEAGKGARKRASRDELMAAPAPIPQLVEKLIFPGRLLVAENTGGRATVTLAHEALLQKWAALRDWLGTDDLILIQRGVEAWNAWRAREPYSRPNLRRADLSGADLQDVDLHEAKLGGANLSGADLQGANLSEAELSGTNLSGADLQGADLREAELREANLSGADLQGASLSEAELSGANLSGADLQGANLRQAKMSGANLQKANLRRASLGRADLKGADLRQTNLIEADLREADLRFAVLVGTDLTNADLTGCRVYAISAWDVKLEGAKQQNLIITETDEPRITVDDMEVVSFSQLFLHGEKILGLFDALTSKIVLILGRFTNERKAVLDALRSELLKRNYLPIVFDFSVPARRDITESISLLARMTRFIIADLTDPSSIPQELEAIVPHLAVPVQPLLEGASRPFAMFRDYQMYDWVLPIHRYEGLEPLLATLAEKVIAPAEGKVKALEERRRMIEAELTSRR